MSLLAPATASTCPLCRADHEALDRFWACPDHGHKLKFTGDRLGDMEIYDCPVRPCTYVAYAPPKPRSPSKGDPMTTALSRPSVAIDYMLARAAHLEQLLPIGLDAGSFTGTAQAALYNNAALMAAAENDPASFMIALTDCAALGHMPDGKNYYLTPRGNKVLGVEGYRGIVQRMYNSGQVGKVIVYEVCERDHFSFTPGLDDYPQHRFGDGSAATGAGFFGAKGSINRGEMVGVYAYAKLLTGEYTRVSLLSREDVHAARASGGWKAADPYSPWNRDDGGPERPELRGRSMWWKTALKRLEPWVPTSSEDKRQPHQVTIQSPAPELPRVPPPAAVAAVQDERRQTLPAARQKPAQRARKPQQESAAPRTGVVTEALRTAIAAQFDKLGLEDETEREVYVCKLAHKDTSDALTDNDLRGALADLAECADMEALIEWCNPTSEAS